MEGGQGWEGESWTGIVQGLEVWGCRGVEGRERGRYTEAQEVEVKELLGSVGVEVGEDILVFEALAWRNR